MTDSVERSTASVAERVRAALAGRDLAALVPLFAPDARWGNCVGGAQIVEWMQGVAAEGLEATLVELEVHEDRLVLGLHLRTTRDDAESASAPRRHYQTAFVVDGQITELQDAADQAQALTALPAAPPPSPLGLRTGIATAAAIFPVRELATALEHYRRLGFAVRAYEGGGYGFVERGDVELHLGEVPDLDPRTNLSAVYLVVDDADALSAEWRAAAVAGQLVEALDTDYGMREGAHVDPDGNRIRFGSPIDG